MTWKTSLIERRVAGAPGNCKVFVATQDNERVRFFIFYGAKIRYTKAYPTLHDGMMQLVQDYQREAKSA